MMGLHLFHLHRRDFGESLQDWVAFTMAFDEGVQCGSKEAYLELKQQTAAEIIEKVRDTFALAVIRSAETLAGDREVFATEEEASDFVAKVAFVTGFARDPEDMAQRVAEARAQAQEAGDE